MSVFPNPTNPGYFNGDVPTTRVPTVSVQQTKLSLNGTLTVEKFIKGGTGLRDPNLTNCIFPSYSAETYFPTRVSRNGIRQTPDIDYAAGTLTDQWYKFGTSDQWGRCACSDNWEVIAVPHPADKTIWISTDKGATWYVTAAFTYTPVQVECTGSGNMIVASFFEAGHTYYHTLFSSVDLGRTWVELPPSPNSLVRYRVFGLSKVGVYGYSPIAISSNVGTNTIGNWFYQGALWISQVRTYGSTPFTGHACAMAAYSHLYVRAVMATDTVGVLVSGDSGATWTQKSVINAAANGSAVVSDSGEKMYIAIPGAKLLASYDYGETWSEIGDARAWKDLAASADGTKLAATLEGGLLIVSSDSGATWTTDATVHDNYGFVAVSSDFSMLFATGGTGVTYDVGYFYTKGSGYEVDYLAFTDAVLDPGEIVVLEYLTNSTTLLPTLYPYN